VDIAMKCKRGGREIEEAKER